jgi:branched-chain amino acid transport system permease protein
MPILSPAAQIDPVSRLPAWALNLFWTLLILACYPLNLFLENNLNDYLYLILLQICLNIVLATSLNLVNGITGQFSLGHAAFMAVGAYSCGSLAKHFVGTGWNPSMAALVFVIVGGFLAAVAGLVVGIPALRLRGDYLAIATLGFGEIIYTIIRSTENIGPFEIGSASGLHGIPKVTNFFWAAAAAIVTVVCVWRLAYSAKGKAFAAIREDEIAAAAMGINTTFYKVAAFVIGAFFAGVAGGLFGMLDRTIDPEQYRFTRSIEIVAIVVLGGTGSITGVVLAAVALTIVPHALRDLKSVTGIDLRLIVYALLLITMMLLRPQGLMGSRELFWTRRRSRRPAKITPMNSSR